MDTENIPLLHSTCTLTCEQHFIVAILKVETDNSRTPPNDIILGTRRRLDCFLYSTEMQPPTPQDKT